VPLAGPRPDLQSGCAIFWSVLASPAFQSDRISSLQPTAVNAILAEQRACSEQGKDLVSLMRGEPDMRTPAHIVEACAASLAAGRTAYPDNRGEPALREAVALKLERNNGLRFDPTTEILVTSGATFGIYAALTTLLNPGDEVLLPDPVYDGYQSPVRFGGGQVKSVRAGIVDGRFVLTAEALEAAWSPAVRVLILNTPWNPVGTVFTPEELKAIAEFCARRGVTILSDEIYEAITYGQGHVSPLVAARAAGARAVLVNSLSKTYAMTGWRVGYCAGPKAVIDAMYQVLMQSSRGPATFIQDAAAAALNGPQDCVAEMQAEYARRRAQVLTALAGIRGVTMLAPEGGFFAMADVRGLKLPSNEIRRRLMREHGVVVVHGSAYGAGGEETLRISFASGGETLARGLHRLREGLLACS
jgi:aspartate aminotransferase